MKKFKVKMTKILAGPEKNATINDILIVDEDFATQLLEDNACEVVEIILPEEATEEEATEEDATEEDATEEDVAEEVVAEEVEEKKGKKSKKSSKRR